MPRRMTTSSALAVPADATSSTNARNTLRMRSVMTPSPLSPEHAPLLGYWLVDNRYRCDPAGERAGRTLVSAKNFGHGGDFGLANRPRSHYVPTAPHPLAEALDA